MTATPKATKRWRTMMPEPRKVKPLVSLAKDDFDDVYDDRPAQAAAAA